MSRKTNRYRLNKEEAKLITELRGHSVDGYDKEDGIERYRMRLRVSEIEALVKYRETAVAEPFIPVKRLFFDIETSPMITYTWRIGNKVSLSPDQILEEWRIITVCYKWEGQEEVNYFTWDENLSDKQLLIDFIKVANTADELIGHNGDRFDITGLRTRCIFHRIPMFPKYRSLDTYKKAKGNFRFSSNKLDYIAKFLGVGAKMKHEGFAMWDKCMKGDKVALQNMVMYCQRDVVVLEDVYQAMKHYIKPETHAGVLQELPKYSCPICAHEEISLLRTDVTEKGTISRVVECDRCGHVYNISNKSYMDYLKYRMNSRV